MTPQQRVFEAQLDLYQAIRGPYRNRSTVADALSSVVATALVAESDTSGIRIDHGYKSFCETDLRWSELEKSVWIVIYKGHTPGVIWAEIETQLAVVGVQVAELTDVMAAYAKQHAHAA